ncbi:MAG: hypothetical protein ACOX2F_05490 [bacterium]
MSKIEKKTKQLDLVNSFEQGWSLYKTHFTKIVPWGLLLMVPSILFHFSIALGIVSVILFQGALLILLADKIDSSLSGIEKKVQKEGYFWNLIKSGTILSIILLPMLLISFVILIIPSIIVFTLFMFSFFIIAQKNKLPVDALMKSYEISSKQMLPLFLFSFILYGAVITSAIISNFVPFLHVVLCGVIIPYFFIVIYKFYEQLEEK